MSTIPDAEALATALPALLNLQADYAKLIDGRQAAEFSDLFGASGALVLPDREVTGAPALTEFAANSPRGVHTQGVPSVRRLDDGTFAATSSFIFLNAVTYTLTAGEYNDVIRAENGRIVFARRQITVRVRTADEPPAE